jgi:DNA-binding NarL/FixJ family response regulator
LVGIEDAKVSMLVSALRRAGATASPQVERSFNVSELGQLAPQILLCDIDASGVDPLEFLRRLRFVLPESILAVYTAIVKTSWARECHLAGANCILSKESSEAELALGLRGATVSGCFTDPRVAAA